MNDVKFFRKKQLLAQRDDLLEEIGQAIFQSGRLPEQFQLLRQEFHSKDILLDQLRDRYRALKEERDRAQLDDTEMLAQLAKLDTAFERRLRAPRRDYREISLKLEHKKDKQKRVRRIRKDRAQREMEAQAAELKAVIDKVEDERRAQRRELTTRMKPIQERLTKLDGGIRKVQDEEDHLSLSRQKRLQDLGYHYYAKGLESDRFGSVYDQLNTLKKELADNRKEPAPELWDAPRKVERGNWRLIASLLLLALTIGYFFRTQFRQADLSFDGLVDGLPREPGDSLLYLNVRQVDPALAKAGVPAFTELPGGDVFREMTTANLVEALVIQENNGLGVVRFCGLKYDRAPARVGLRLRQNGWTFTSTATHWQAWTDRDKAWVWLALNDRSFVLLPSGDLQRFEAQTPVEANAWLRMDKRINSFNANEPLLHGLDQMRVSLGPDRFSLELAASAPLADFDTRTAYLERLIRRAPSPTLDFRLQNHRLEITGPTASFDPDSLADEDLRAFIRRSIESLQDAARKSGSEDAIPLRPLPIQARREAMAPSGFQQRIVVFAVDRQQGLSTVDEISFNGVIRDMAYLDKRRELLVADELNQAIVGYQTIDRRLVRSRELRFDRPAEQGGPASRPADSFYPRFIAASPDERYAVALERRANGLSFLALIDLATFRPVWMEELPRRVAFGVSAAWSANGDTVFLGCAARKGRRSGSPAVLVYRRQEEVLTLTRLIDLDFGNASWHAIAGIEAAPSEPALYLRQEPQGRLVRLRLELDGAPQPESLRLHDSSSTATLGQFDGSGRDLALNRTGELALTFDPAGSRRGAIYLTDIKSTQLTLADSLDLGLSAAFGIRAPLSDRFWLASPRDRRLALVRIEKNRLVLEDAVQLDRLEPRQLAVGQWGALLFMSATLDQ